MGKKKHLCLCENCGKEFQAYYSSTGKYCSSECSAEAKSKKVYELIKIGDPSIMRASYSPRSAYKYIMKEQNNKCAICGMQNIWLSKPLRFIIDHIDGDASNNRRENLRCICPNCDSQLDTYKNTGNRKSSRNYRMEQYRNKASSFNG